MKETLVRGSNRKTASPTESAVGRNWRRERSGAGCLSRNPWKRQERVRAAREHALSEREDQPGNILDGGYGCSMRVVPRIIAKSILFVPECRKLRFGAFSCVDISSAEAWEP